MLTVLVGDVLEQLAKLPDESVQCCVTSPPFWGLRDYGTARWQGGDEGCDHRIGRVMGNANKGNVRDVFDTDRDFCKCGAIRIDSQIGLERTPEDYVNKLVAVFREVRRVLRDDGTCWVNLGDSYAGSAKGMGADGTAYGGPKQRTNNGSIGLPVTKDIPGLKPKDLCMIPARVALALQADGWWLRSDIIWSKPNPMPESVTDRPTKAHEYIFLLSKRERYFFDQDAVRESGADTEYTRERYKYAPSAGPKHNLNSDTNISSTDFAQYFTRDGKRNIRTVWEIATQPYPDAHFATFPEDIPKRCILAGTSARGCCPNCLAPWERVTERTSEVDISAKGSRFDSGKTGINGMGRVQNGERYLTAMTGWQPTCTCGLDETKPCTVLDPFAGSGTTLKVALELGRQAIGIELNPEYAAMINRRCQTTIGLPL